MYCIASRCSLHCPADVALISGDVLVLKPDPHQRVVMIGPCRIRRFIAPIRTLPDDNPCVENIEGQHAFPHGMLAQKEDEICEDRVDPAFGIEFDIAGPVMCCRITPRSNCVSRSFFISANRNLSSRLSAPALRPTKCLARCPPGGCKASRIASAISTSSTSSVILRKSSKRIACATLAVSPSCCSTPSAQANNCFLISVSASACALASGSGNGMRFVILFFVAERVR